MSGSGVDRRARAMAALWLRLLLAVGLPVAALVAVAFLVYRRRSSPRNAPPELPEVAPAAAGPEPTASPGLAKLNMRYSAARQRPRGAPAPAASVTRILLGGGVSVSDTDTPRICF